MTVPTISWSNFAISRHLEPLSGPYTLFKGDPEELIRLIKKRWHQRYLANGNSTIDKVCAVSVNPNQFVCPVVRIEDDMICHAKVIRRRPEEAPYIQTTVEGSPLKALTAEIILYSAAELEQTNERSTDSDWEIISINASPVIKEPMTPLAMARNQLEMPGGSPRHYSSDEWALAVWYWSQHALKHM